MTAQTLSFAVLYFGLIQHVVVYYTQQAQVVILTRYNHLVALCARIIFNLLGVGYSCNVFNRKDCAADYVWKKLIRIAIYLCYCCDIVAKCLEASSQFKLVYFNNHRSILLNIEIVKIFPDFPS